MSNTAKKATPEEVWAVIKELGEAQKKTEEAHRRTKKTQRKTEEALQEYQKKTEESQRKTEESLRKLSQSLDKASGNFNNKWGAFMESLVSGNLVSLLKDWGVPVDKVTSRKTLYRVDQTPFAEYDLVAYNGEAIVVVEVKTTLTQNKVDTFIKKLRRYSQTPHEFPNKTIYGGVGYLDSDETAPQYAERSGLFVIKAPGGSSNISTIINGPHQFKPKAF